MDEITQHWFEATVERSKVAAEELRGKRGQQSASAAGVVDYGAPREWEFRSVKLRLVPGLNVACRVLGAALDRAEWRHMISGHMWLEAFGPSGEKIDTGFGQIETFVVERSAVPILNVTWNQAQKDLEAKLSESQEFAAVQQAAALEQVAEVPSPRGVVHGVRI